MPLLGAGKDGAVPLSGGASQCPPPANPIPGHTEHVQELCKWRGGKQRDRFRGEFLTPPTSYSCPTLLPGSDKGAMVLPQVLLPSPSPIPDPSGCCLQGCDGQAPSALGILRQLPCCPEVAHTLSPVTSSLPWCRRWIIYPLLNVFAFIPLVPEVLKDPYTRDDALL